MKRVLVLVALNYDDRKYIANWGELNRKTLILQQLASEEHKYLSKGPHLNVGSRVVAIILISVLIIGVAIIQMK